MQSGHYKLQPYALTTQFDDDMIHIEKWNPNMPVSVIYFDGEKEQYMVKRFLIEPSSKKTLFITEHEKSHLECAITDLKAKVKVQFDQRANKRPDEEIKLWEFIDVKNLKAKGNRLTTYKIKTIDILEPEAPSEEELQALQNNAQ